MSTKKNNMNNTCLDTFFSEAILSVNTLSTSNFNILQNVAATPVVLEVRNTDNTNSSSNSAVSIINNSATGKSYIQYANGAGNFFASGQVSSTTNFAINAAQSPSTGSNALTMLTSGNLSGSFTPGFIARKATSQVNATGNGTLATIIFDATIENLGGNYDGTTGTFTAPATAIYRLSTSVTTTSSNGTSGIIQIVTTSETYELFDFSPNNFAQSDGVITISGSVLTNMNAGDTAIVQVKYSGGTLTTSIPNSSTGNWFAGILVE